MRLVEWPRGNGPRRAGVSSFGVGGTNAHVVLEEAPLPAPVAAGRLPALLPLSARDAAALRRRRKNIAARRWLARRRRFAGYRVDVGRRPQADGLARRRGGAERRRGARDLARLVAREAMPAPGVVFLFPGQGAQHVGMARELAAAEPVFAAAFRRCCALASARLGCDLAALILPPPGDDVAQAAAMLAQTRYTQPALFAVEYALAELFESWGVAPVAMIGHSVGEYVAACRAGVFALDDAVDLVTARAAAMQAQPPGAMLALRCGEDAIAGRLPPGIELAACNAPSLCVVAGTAAAIDAYAVHMAGEGVAGTRLESQPCFSFGADGRRPAPFRRAFEGVRLSRRSGRTYSCVQRRASATLDAGDVAGLLIGQLRRPVRYADALGEALPRAASGYCSNSAPARR